MPRHRSLLLLFSLPLRYCDTPLRLLRVSLLLTLFDACRQRATLTLLMMLAIALHAADFITDAADMLMPAHCLFFASMPLVYYCLSRCLPC